MKHRKNTMKRAVSVFMAATLVCSTLCISALAASYTVKSGDTMSAIAAAQGVSLAELTKANPQVSDPNVIYPGDELTVPGTAAETPAAGSADSVSAGVSGMRVVPLEGYETVPVPTDVISYDNDMVMNYIQEFANFTQVPRPSYNTAKMTEYLEVWAAARGIDCVSDTSGNVVMNVPATKGYEDSPLVIFQGHIDMVPATDPGVVHDWANDPLDLLWTSNSVKADGTSLGADNGSGLAFMLTYMSYEDEFNHGPLRFVFTVDEEVGLLGAHALDAKYVNDAKYMVNVDGGYGGAIISCAGGAYYNFEHEARWVSVPAGYSAYAMEYEGLKGGHSAGVGGGKANALVAMANAMLALDQAGVEFQIASFSGGSATNAIPVSSKAVVVMDKADTAKADAVLAELAKKFKGSYEAVETDYTFTYGASAQSVSKALDADLSVRLVQLMSTVPNNIHTLLATASGTESSSNLGTLTVDENTVAFCCMMRSSSKYQTEQITMMNTALAEMAGFEMTVPGTFATWPLKANNKLSAIAADLFYEMTGTEYKLSAIHAGVECGEFAEKSDDLFIISTGVSGGSAGHTTAEAMNFDKVDVSMDFLITLAERLAEEG